VPIIPRTAVVIRNPRARNAPSEAVVLREALDHLVSIDWGVDIQTTTAAGHATELAQRAARQGVEVVIAVGGDGTINEVVNGLLGSESSLAVLPAGTANVWAREAGVPFDIGRAMALVPHARRVRIDLGRIRSGERLDRRFLLMCGVGMDAEAVRRLHGGSWTKRWFGMGAYVGVAVNVMTRYQPMDTRIVVDDVTLEGPMLQLVAGNTRLYGGVARITAGARVDDGLLDLCTFSGPGLLHRAALAFRAARGGLDARNGAGIDYVRGARIEVETEWPLPVQIDGEYLCETPIRLSLDPLSVNVLIAPEPNVLLTRG
jgi:diacylglycerol kinase (ATP)